jgi:hypothetical protein
VTPEAINKKWVEMYGEPEDGQLSVAEVSWQAREAEGGLSPLVEVG